MVLAVAELGLSSCFGSEVGTLPFHNGWGTCAGHQRLLGAPCAVVSCVVNRAIHLPALGSRGPQGRARALLEKAVTAGGPVNFVGAGLVGLVLSETGAYSHRSARPAAEYHFAIGGSERAEGFAFDEGAVFEDEFYGLKKCWRFALLPNPFPWRVLI